MKIQYRVTQDDFVELTWASFKANKKLRYTRYALVAVGLAITLLPFWSPPFGERFPDWFIPVGLVVAWCGIGPVLFLSWFARKNYKKQAALHQDSEVEITDESLAGRSSIGTSEVKWNAFDRFIETKNLFVLFRGVLFYIFPKRAFAAGDAEEFRALLNQKFPPVKS